MGNNIVVNINNNNNNNRNNNRNNNNNNRNQNNRRNQNNNNRRYFNGDRLAGVMTSREKAWVLNVQMLQLQVDDPYKLDYYYTVRCLDFI